MSRSLCRHASSNDFIKFSINRHASLMPRTMDRCPLPTDSMTLHSPLIIDVAGLALCAADRQRLAHPLVGGIILFARNWQDRLQLTALCRSIKDLRPDVLICVDHEGGRVQRFKTDGLTHLPPMRTLGQLWHQDTWAAQKAAMACGYVMGAELRACGVDLSFAPVLDLDYGASSVIGDRAFDADAAVVCHLAQSLMHGLLMAGMANCGKHFPGHGYVVADSHTDTPVDTRGLDAILADDAAPYQRLGLALTGVMPAHVVYPAVDARPAGFSGRWLQGILRERLGFEGAIFSDDLSMAAARVIDGLPVSYTQSALVALQAGCDLVLLCNQSVGDGAAIDQLIDGLTQAMQQGQEQGLWQPQTASEARRRSLLGRGTAATWESLRVQPAYLQAKSVVSGIAA